MKRIVIAILLFALLTSCATNEIQYISRLDTSTVKLEGIDADYDLLKNAGTFACGGIGDAGTMPEEIAAFGRLFKQTNALELFYKLEAEGSNVGKLYALCGLYYLDYNYYSSLMNTYSKNESEIITISGCEVSKERISKIIRVDGAMRLKDNKETLGDWSKRTNIHEYTLDFYGGSIPEFLMEYLNRE
ncbi:MAG: hypothetical protein LBS74_02735 [Oscillospiraceae bacterium]|jgi:hypothetical protein|nr:hypothetical protein [Oscillospiraceae bacterium]